MYKYYTYELYWNDLTNWINQIKTARNMGNSNISVARYANKTFGSFVEQLKLEELKEASSGNFQKHMDYIFSVFLEDFFVCDETFLDFSGDDKVKCAGCLLFLYSTISSSLVEKFPNPPKFGPALLAGFVNDSDPSMLLKCCLLLLVLMVQTFSNGWAMNGFNVRIVILFVEIVWKISDPRQM